MDTFFDTSAVVPLLLAEPHSNHANTAWTATDRAFAWTWLRVETEAALVRRKAKPAAWKNWRRLAGFFDFLSFPDSDLAALCEFNRTLGLRATDAGHLFVFERLHQARPAVALATFDKEMAAAADALRLPSIGVSPAL